MTKSGRPSEIGFYDFALIIMNKCCVGTCLNETQGEFVLQFWHQFKVPLDWCIIRHLIPWLSALVITDPTTPPGADRLGWSATGECAWWAERLPAHCEDENKLRWCLRQEPEIRRAVSVKGSFLENQWVIFAPSAAQIISPAKSSLLDFTFWFSFPLTKKKWWDMIF